MRHRPVRVAFLHPQVHQWLAPLATAGGVAALVPGASGRLTRKQRLVHNQVGRWSTFAARTVRTRGFLAGDGWKEPAVWRDERQDGSSMRECRQPSEEEEGEEEEVVWLKKGRKPAWGDAQLSAREMSPCPSGRSFPHAAHSRVPGGWGRSVTAEAVSWLCHESHLDEAVEALEILVRRGSCVSTSLVYTVLMKCAAKKDVALGSRVHALTVEKGLRADTLLCNHVLRMYASHGRLEEAMEVFESVAEPDAFTWSSIISAHVRHGHDKQAVELYHRMRRSDVRPDGHVFVAALQACARGADLESGQQVHADVLASGAAPDLFVWNCLVSMYAKCGNLEEARRVFDGLGEKDVVTWNALIGGYSQQGMGQEALHLYAAMQGFAAPNSVTFVCLLQACASLGTAALESGKQLHARIREQGLEADVFVANSLVNMYAKCGSLEDAQAVFDGLGMKNVVTWNAMIAGYSQQGLGPEALRLYTCMEKHRAVPNSVTFMCLLQACASVGTSALDMGKQLHSKMRYQGQQVDVFLGSGLVNMYAKCGSLEDARRVFDVLDYKDVVTWTALIAGYSQKGMGHEALCLYSGMQEDGIAVPNAVTLVCLLQACASVGTPALEKGKQLHTHIREKGLEADVFVSSSLVNMYAKCGSLENAQTVFNDLVQKDSVTWNAMIAGYSQQGMGQEALRLYSRMQKEGIAVPDAVTFVCLLQACANVAALCVGRQLHARIVEQGLQADVFVVSSLMNMYGKSGSMPDAQQLFSTLPERGIIAWNSLIAGYACQGESQAVFDLVETMTKEGVEPDGVTFLSVLTVCSHGGLVNKGREYFDAMSKRYGIQPTEEHYACMVDILGRAGQVGEALKIVRSMSVQPNVAVWHTLLAACRKWDNLEVARHAFNEAVKLDKSDAAAYVLMSNIYTGAQMWEQAKKSRARRLKVRAWKQPGQSWWTDNEGRVHSFLVGDEKQPRSKDEAGKS